MTSVELNHREKNCDDFSEIHLGVEDERCGEIFITHTRNIIFHCTICASNFGSYDYFLDHLSTEHYEEVKEEEEEVIEIEAETERPLQNVKIDFKPIFGQIEEVFLEESNSCSLNKTEHTVDEFEEYDLEKIKDEEETEAQILCTQFLDETSNTTKSSSSPRKRRRGVRPFICKECGKEFKTTQKLERHCRTHSNERHHQCHICGVAFKERTDLDVHARRHTGIRPISCDYCSKRFFTHSEAKTHRRTHTGERPFVCSICGMAFINGGGLKMHVMKHNSDPSFKCNVCGKCFYGKSELKEHLVVHTKEKPFVCHICGSSFPRYFSMIRHIKLMHEKNKI